MARETPGVVIRRSLLSICKGCRCGWKGDVRNGSKADTTSLNCDVRFAPKADIAELHNDVRFVPKGDIDLISEKKAADRPSLS